MSGTVWDIGIYDETQGAWVGERNTGTTCTVNTATSFTLQNGSYLSDPYVAGCGRDHEMQSHLQPKPV